MASKSSLTMVTKSFLTMVPRSSLIMVPKGSLIMIPKKSLNMVPKGSVIIIPKSTKSPLIKKSLHTYKPFSIIVTTTSFLKIRTLKKIKSKFAALLFSTQNLIFVYPIMYNGQIRFKNLAKFAVKFLKFI